MIQDCPVEGEEVPHEKCCQSGNEEASNLKRLALGRFPSIEAPFWHFGRISHPESGLNKLT